jgi:hypothetical protein
MDYKPYSEEWHRYRYLKEALDRYLDDYVDNQTVVGDILDILNSRCVKAHQEFQRTNELEYMLRKSQ